MRHHQNKNISLTLSGEYRGLPIQTQHGPLGLEYLERLQSCIASAQFAHPRVFAFRVDLRLPYWLDADDFLHDNLVIERFIASFKAKIRHNRLLAKQENRYAHDSSVRFVWTREIAGSDRPHYHLVILLNNDAFCTLGKFELGRNNLFNRLIEAWASALGLAVEQAVGLVQIPDNHAYLLQRGDQQGIEAFFYRASYLCKAATKHYGNGCHGFGASRI